MKFKDKIQTWLLSLHVRKMLSYEYFHWIGGVIYGYPWCCITQFIKEGDTPSYLIRRTKYPILNSTGSYIPHVPCDKCCIKLTKFLKVEVR